MLEQRRVGRPEVDSGRRPAAQLVAAGRLDLDHPGAGVGEELARVRPGDPGRQLEHDDVIERVHRDHTRVTVGSTPASRAASAPRTSPPGSTWSQNWSAWPAGGGGSRFCSISIASMPISSYWRWMPCLAICTSPDGIAA